jgi:putative transposase
MAGHERVRNSLKRQSLCPVYKRPYRVTTDSAHHKAIAPNVLDRRFDGWKVNQAWVDITYIATGEGWLYLACVMDLASRKIVGWSMSDRIKAELVYEALKSAYWRRKPTEGLIVHSDRGSQYASDQHRQLIKDYRMIQSMSRRANCWDNAAMESFFKTLRSSASICFATKPAPLPSSTSSTGSKASIITGASIPRSATKHRLIWNPAL